MLLADRGFADELVTTEAVAALLPYGSHKRDVLLHGPRRYPTEVAEALAPSR